MIFPQKVSSYYLFIRLSVEGHISHTELQKEHEIVKSVVLTNSGILKMMSHKKYG
jgi:hypothetical protein